MLYWQENLLVKNDTPLTKSSTEKMKATKRLQIVINFVEYVVKQFLDAAVYQSAPYTFYHRYLVHLVSLLVNFSTF